MEGATQTKAAGTQGQHTSPIVATLAPLPSANLPTPTPGNFLAVIAAAALDPKVDVQKMHGLLDVQERMMAKQAEIDFNADFARLQADLPRITKDAKIVHKGNLIGTYATYEKIDDVIRPLLIKHGFGLRFNTEPTTDRVIITATLSHKSGHSITDKIPLTIDASGAKNNVQGVGSTIAYGKRYLVGMLLNLVFEGDDDDGKSADYAPITDDQAATLKDMIRETGTDTRKFLSIMVSGVDSVDQIGQKDYDRVYNALLAKRRHATKGGAA